jgi:hypothetical protein
MAEDPLVAHSVAEARLYLMVTPCASCQKGPLRDADEQKSGERCSAAVLSIRAKCDACQAITTTVFALPDDDSADPGDGTLSVNPTDEPSRIIDVAQWLTLFRMLTEAAGKERDKIKGRQRAIEAAQCLEEALKFYDEEDNDLPPPEALFHDRSRERFKENPEHFSRQRLINLRSKLPSRPSPRPNRTPDQTERRGKR